jgi:dynein heavy chain
MLLKATVRPDYKPEDIDTNDKKQIPDENAWVFEGFNKMKERLEESIKPLDDYMLTYGKYVNEYKLDPDAVIKKLDDDDNPPEIDFLRKDVIFH